MDILPMHQSFQKPKKKYSKWQQKYPVLIFGMVVLQNHEDQKLILYFFF